MENERFVSLHAFPVPSSSMYRTGLTEKVIGSTVFWASGLGFGSGCSVQRFETIYSTTLQGLSRLRDNALCMHLLRLCWNASGDTVNVSQDGCWFQCLRSFKIVYIQTLANADYVTELVLTSTTSVCSNRSFSISTWMSSNSGDNKGDTK